MATSPNYAWAEPDNSSLVKNGAADIRTLGDAIDTSVWNVGFGQAGKNKIINGDFGIWQRGTSFTSPASAAYTADRFSSVQNGTGTSTVSRQTFTLGTAPVAGYEGTFFLRHEVTAVGTSTANGFEQRIESVKTFANQTVTISFWAKTDSARTISARIDQYFGSGGSPSATVVGTTLTFSATTTWTRFTATQTLASIAGKTLGTNNNDALYVKLLNANTLGSQIDIWGVQLEYGSKATPFQTASGGSPQAELAMCQRYYWRAVVDATGRRFGVGYNASTTQAFLYLTYPIEMRAVPTALEQSGTASDYTINSNTTATCSVVPTYQGATKWNATVVFEAASGLTAGYGANGRSANANAYLGWSAEL